MVTTNRRARHDYDVLESVEAGIVLAGAEVKSLRAGEVQLRDAHARVQGTECWLHGVHLSPYEHANLFDRPDPDRPRKLLLHRHQIEALAAETRERGLTIVPLQLYFKDGRAKVELALARGKKLHDKRQALAERQATREMAREMTRRNRGER